eukprot:202253_1
MLPVTIFSMCLTTVVVHRLCCFWGLGVSPPVDAATQMGGEYMAPDEVRCHCEAARALPLGLRGILGIGSEVAVNGHRQGGKNKNNKDEGGSIEIMSYASPVFSRLRETFGVSNERFLASFPIGLPLVEFQTNSKSPQGFFSSFDGKYMIKTMSEWELRSLLDFIREYEAYVKQNTGSLIVQFHGAYRVIVTQRQRNCCGLKRRRSSLFVVTSNVFYTNRPISQRYDLKGSTVGRQTRKYPLSIKFPITAVLKDLDLAEDGPLRVGAMNKVCLLNTLKHDTEFLSRIGIIDYSLLVGVQKDRGLLSWPASLVRWSMHPLLTLYRVLLNNLLHVHIMPYGYRRICTKDGSAVLHVGVIDVLTRYTLRKVNDT